MEKERDEFSDIGIDDVVTILEADYKNAYFVTGTLFVSVTLLFYLLIFEIWSDSFHWNRHFHVGNLC